MILAQNWPKTTKSSWHCSLSTLSIDHTGNTLPTAAKMIPIWSAILKWNFCLWDFCSEIIKFEPLLDTFPTLFFVYGKGKLLFSCSKLAGWAQNWWPSWPGQNSVVMSLVVLLSCHVENLEWLWEKRLVFKAPQKHLCIFIFGLLLQTGPQTFPWSRFIHT